MRRLDESDYKAFRFKEAFYLYKSLSEGNASLVYRYKRNIKSIDNRNHDLALKVVRKLKEAQVEDYEGYVRAGFLVFNKPYLNMLLNSKVLENYVRHLTTRLNQFSNNIISCLHKFSVDCTTPPISLVRNEESKFILAAKQVDNPIVRLYLILTYTNRVPSRSLIKQAMLQYRLWPFAFHTTKVGKLLLDKIDYIINAETRKREEYDSTMEKNDNKLLCKEE